MKRLSINLTGKLFAFFILIGLGAVFLTAIPAYFYTRHAILERAFQQLNSVRVLKKNRVESFFADRIADVTYLSEHTGKRCALNETNVSAFLESSRYFAEAFWRDENTFYAAHKKNDTTEVLYYSEQWPDSIESMLKFFINQPHSHDSVFPIDFRIDSGGEHGNRIMLAFVPSDTGDRNSFLALTLPADVLNHIMLVSDNLSGLGESGESYLVGNDFFMRSSSRFDDDSFLNIPVRNNAVDAALAGIEGTDIVQDYRNEKVLSSFSPLSIHGLRWVILAEIDYSEVLKGVKKARNRILLISIIMTLIILPVSFLLTGNITHPIIRLNSAIKQVSEGSFDVRISGTTNDEIGSLTESFNEMASTLKAKSDALKEREERLQHFYDATKDAIILHYDGIPVLLNQATVLITGYTEEELKRIHIDSFLIIQTDTTSKSPFRNFVYETKLVRKDQSLLDVEVQDSVVEYKGSYIKSLVIRDVSRRKKAEKALFEEREKRMSSLIDGQEMERQRLSRELHDSLGQSLIAIKLLLESASSAETSKSEKILRTVREHFDTTIDEVRRISNNLMPAVLYEFGIQTALSNLCKRVEETAVFELNFYSNLTGDFYNNKIKTYIYRIAQEALNNCIKHSGATLVKLYLLESSGYVKLIINDNGKGFTYNENESRSSKGLVNMRERAALIQAVFDFKSVPGQGTEISVTIPILHHE